MTSYGINANGYPVINQDGSAAGTRQSGVGPNQTQSAAQATNNGAGNCPPPLTMDPVTGGCVSPNAGPAPNPTGTTTPAPTPPAAPAPGVPPFTNTSPVTPPTPGAPGTYAPGSPNDPAWKETDPSKALLTMLNNKTAGGVSPSQLVALLNQKYSGAKALYYAPGTHDSSQNEYVGFPGGYLSRVPGGDWTYTARSGSEGSGANPGVNTPGIDIQKYLAMNPPNMGPGPIYDPYKFSISDPYKEGSTGPMTEDLLKKLLTTTSLSPEVVAQMKEGAKSTLLSGTDQLKQSALQSAAQRGTIGGGGLAGNNAALDANFLSSLSSGYRNVDITKATQDRIDQQNAMSASDAYQQQLLQEYLGSGNLRLGQETAQATDNFRGYQSKEQQFQDQFGQWLAKMGLNVNMLNFDEFQRQFNLTNQLNVNKWLAGGN